jgi:hypothetical protein
MKKDLESVINDLRGSAISKCKERIAEAKKTGIKKREPEKGITSVLKSKYL